MNDGLIANAIQFAAQGAPSLITLWDKTHGQIKAVSAMTTYPLYLVTRDPDVKKLADFSDKDKIAVPSVKIRPRPSCCKWRRPRPSAKRTMPSSII